ncbi:MAG: cyanophycinase [Flavobacterium sp.]|uniref:cyanophycinase n=1 Tax=Flavobacterium sp. TaxID=239 RepID=UPI001B0A76B1|nr:cyanophycinase [Flavobacterium sp.]MBO9586542.1 cyanophycinase [Flavobacterium sp.]
MKILAITFLMILSACSSENNRENAVPKAPEAKNYVSYFSGNKVDKITAPQGGICLMGGAAENDEAMKWFLKRAEGGDVLILRTSGSDGYNSYLYTSLGVAVNSVETIVFKNAAASSDQYILDKINKAEAIWFAGGDQWEYVSYWRNTPISEAINKTIIERKVVVGGTSAGMAIQGGFYFSAQNGTITSQEALLNPFDAKITLSHDVFLNNAILKDVITDTHYDNPDRKGRHVIFLARIINDYKVQAKGIACEEYTSVCIDDKGIARVFGNYPSKEDVAYFIMPNNEIPDNRPEICKPNNPLEWNLNNVAISVYEIKGTSAGTNTFNLNNWNEGKGGVWKKWFVENGKLKE